MISVILTGYGGPQSLDDVGPFMSSIATAVVVPGSIPTIR